jgi:putative glutamine amidotransferase
LITGGAFDVDPALFGAGSRHSTVTLKARRTEFELAIVKGALDRDKPILGICGGEQLLAVALGGTLVQHIPDEVESPLAHEQPNPRTEPGHDVVIENGTLLHKITGKTSIPVNSAHHQSVKEVPATITVNSRSSDGVIEGIEDKSRRFCLGVQWHPEYGISPADNAVFKAFIEACK